MIPFNMIINYKITINIITGAFIIPFMVMLFLVGTPLLLLELALGQRFRVGAAAAWPKVLFYSHLQPFIGQKCTV